MPRDEISIAQGGLVLFFAIVGLLHVLDRRDLRFHFVSEYAFTHPLLLGVAFLGLGVAGLAVALALWRASRRYRNRVAAALLVVSALAVLALGVFPTDHEGRGPATTTVGRIHDAASGLAFFPLILALALAWSATSPRGRRALALVLGVVLLAAIVPPVLAPDWIGVHQRAFVGTQLVALALLVRAMRGRGRGLPPPERPEGATA